MSRVVKEVVLSLAFYALVGAPILIVTNPGWVVSLAVGLVCGLVGPSLLRRIPAVGRWAQ